MSFKILLQMFQPKPLYTDQSRQLNENAALIRSSETYQSLVFPIQDDGSTSYEHLLSFENKNDKHSILFFPEIFEVEFLHNQFKTLQYYLSHHVNNPLFLSYHISSSALPSFGTDFKQNLEIVYQDTKHTDNAPVLAEHVPLAQFYTFLIQNNIPIYSTQENSEFFDIRDNAFYFDKITSLFDRFPNKKIIFPIDAKAHLWRNDKEDTLQDKVFSYLMTKS